MRERLGASERDLLDERRRAELRDQFMAVLGHDLRNPLSAIQAATSVLGAMGLDAPARRAVAVIRNSSGRMHGLIENLLDFARGQLGEGLPLSLETITDLDVTIDQVISEMRTAWPERAI
ncbi:MAG: sensor histidine kinase, partial [Proteobacteria bacterium]|nr:sensor histidine kinase [Pseudomonadota bacterium]